jgi:TonB family protein
MRWSMVPVSAAAHGAILFALFINPARGGDLPTPWPVRGIQEYLQVSAAPLAVPVPRLPDAVVRIGAAPIAEPSGIQDEVFTANDGPISELATPPMDVRLTSGLPPGFSTGVMALTPSPPVQERPAPVRAGGLVREPKKIVNVPAVYPEIARAAKIEGRVIIEAMIDERGFVTGARVLGSVPLLDAAALAALAQWRYTPTLLNGVPVRVLMTITFNFRLGDRVP